MMTMKEYLEMIGDRAMAQRLGVSRRAVQSWRLGDRTPRPNMARRIIEVSEGKLDYSGIYEKVGSN